MWNLLEEKEEPELWTRTIVTTCKCNPESLSFIRT